MGPGNFGVQIDGQPETFSASESDIRRAPEGLDDTAKLADAEEVLMEGVETLSSGTNEMEDDDEGFFDALLDGMEDDSKK